VPWLVIWDDHEVDNDYADLRSEDLDPQFLARRAAGYQAYFEHMPLPESARPRGPDARIHSRYDFGRLARIHLLDGRQYRTPQACPRPGRGGANVVGEDCPRPRSKPCCGRTPTSTMPTPAGGATRSSTSRRARPRWWRG
jgi:alkaline phosphatase D